MSWVELEFVRHVGFSLHSSETCMSGSTGDSDLTPRYESGIIVGMRGLHPVTLLRYKVINITNGYHRYQKVTTNRSF